MGIYELLLQLLVLRAGLLQDGQFGVSVFPQGEKLAVFFQLRLPIHLHLSEYSGNRKLTHYQ